LHSALTVNDHWVCEPGLRLENEKQTCGQEILPSCMEAETPSVTTDANPKSPTTTELQNTKMITMNAKTFDQTSTIQQTETSTRHEASAQTTLEMPLTSHSTSLNYEAYNSQKTTSKKSTSQQKATSDKIGSITTELLTITTQSPEMTVPGYKFVLQENQVNTSQVTTGNWSQSDGPFRGNINTTDCLTTHALEKHTITVVQGPSVPSIDLSVPVYSVEINDYIWGSFANISCIDTVHTSINVKVNELLHDFVNRIGSLACQDAPDASLEMSAGNIRFLGTRSSPDNATTLLVTTHPPVQVFTIPNVQMKFAGTFTSSSPDDQIDDQCIKEYKAALIRVFSMVEQNLHPRMFSDIYTVIDKDVSITINDKKVIAEVTVNLIPLQESVDFSRMSKCANFTSLQFREPPQKTLSVTASRMSNFKCPVLILSAHGFRSDTSKMNLYCTHGYVTDKSNFKCINESLPLHSTRIEIAVTGTYEEIPCKHVIETSTEQLMKDIFKEIQNGLLKGTICNGTKIITFLQDQGNITIGRQGVNITVPVILINLQFNKPETQDCIQQIYKYLKSAILQPISTMITTLSATCKANLSVPLNFKVSSKRWICLPGRVYNPLIHYCEVQIEPSPTQTIVSDRGKRSVAYPQLRPQWNASLPTCIDFEPPTFHSCPVGPVVINLGTFGPVAATKPLPTVTDNSGMMPTLTVKPDINVLNRFGKNTTFVMVAKDEAGNNATCTFNVTIFDQVPPSITCPRNIVTVSAKSQQGIPQIKYNNTIVTAVDNSGYVNIIYDPPDGAPITTSEIIIVTASAIDGSLNKANCSFFARDLSCVVSCPAGKGFAVQPSEFYNCSGKSGIWQPHNKVLECIESRFPDFEVRLSFDLPYQGNTTGDCLKEMLDAVIESVKLRFSSACLNATQDLNFTNIDSVGAFHKGPVMAAKLKISIQSAFHNMTKTTTPQLCGSAVLNHIQLNDTLLGSCGQLKLSTPVAKAGKDSCPRGFSYVSGMCFGCPQGQYSTEPKCLECPIGTFQNSPGSSECINCTNGYSTLHEGARDKDECIAKCKSNHFSVTGLEPCLPCSLGTHQPKPGSMDCDACDFDSDGRLLSLYCKKLCVPGEYSSDGAIPCTPCPKNYYSQINGSTTCLKCPDNKVTLRAGSWNMAHCEVHDPCQNNPCQKGSHCKPYGDSFVCECLPGFKGFTGTTCSPLSELDHCLSNPCVYGYCTNTATGFNCSCYSGYHGKRCHMKIDNCVGVICYNEGVCVDDLVGFHCICVNFMGKYCDVRMDQCEVNNCHNGGLCIRDTKTLKCLCPEGFTGDLCEVNIDDCSSSPCLNNGVCLDGINSYRCFCLSEYTGHNCEFVVDPCEAGACLNGALCVKTLSSEDDIHCECREGYTGERCEVEIDFCQPMPCSMQGSSFCEDIISSFKCHCLPGWKGDRCDEQIDPCGRHQCYNGGICDNNTGDTFTCVCPPMFTGPTCLISLNSCESNPCQNSGSCIEENATFSCLCHSGFTGLLCEENINECEPNPCLNSGLCQDGVNAFFCSCRRGFAGELCEVNIDECLSHPCLHNSNCTQLDSDFKCNCVAGFTGKQCETDIDECSPNPCQHQGKCVDQISSFYCICPKGHTGATCEETVDKCHDNITCLNNATCHEIDGKVVCLCTHHFTGPDCGKKKSANFDLHFLGDQTMKSQPPVIHTGNLSEISLCLWVKFNHPDSHGTFLVLASEDGHNIFLTLSGFHATAPIFASEEVNLNNNGGPWQHLCVVLTTSHWVIFKNGNSVTQGPTNKWLLQNSLKLTLGQPASYKDTSEWFKGYLHGVNIYSFALDKKDVQNMSQSCDNYMQGNLFDWVTAEPHLFGCYVTMPSLCGEDVSSSGDQTDLVSSSSEDKVPPEVVNCPSTIVVTTEKGLVS
ncbi:unnamed protein product, partial [Candidula unifasciata]